MTFKKVMAGIAITALAVALPWAATAHAEPTEVPPEVSTAANPTDQLLADEASTTIVNGTPASYVDHPFIITGLRVGGGGPQGASCTASVVNERQVITAAHCMIDVSGAKSYLYGDDDLNSPGDELWRSEVVEYLPHPNYGGPNGWRQGHDVAIVTVADDIPVAPSDWVTVATSADSGLTQPGAEAFTLGFGQQSSGGASGVLMGTTLPINNHNDCQVFDVVVNPDQMICAGYNDGRTGICSGDSGGPLIVDGVVVGITSWGSSMCDRYSIFAKMTGQLGDWVDSVLDQEPPEGFTISVDPASGEVDAGESVTATVNTETLAGSDPQEVTLSHTGSGADVTVEFASETIISGESTDVTFTAAAEAADALVDITITGSGTVDHSTGYTLTIGDGPPAPDCFAENNSAQPIQFGWMTTSNLTLECGGATGTITVDIDVTHAAASDLWYMLVAPNGTTHTLKNIGQPDSGTYTANVGTVSGTYTLQIFNLSFQDGTLNAWSAGQS
ncbi:S1 family peptidase [Natronoglycomyces albus]|uniref:Trypsin-like serine protease n=1 Tax=Natronoglycomyces albus TaxID=2811108 RepID=A0A895XLL3_9ACTN|nr:serine protease [Natronoglycomyces albus]QSB04682.1 trypsin-like serine protease [Natronoglycomyces albus]